ncbi:MAG: hypothetical protein ACREM3_09895, partial [Candidatus Rokuibacteriota bacterium]
MPVIVQLVVTFLTVLLVPVAQAGAQSLVASVLPASRSVQVGATATAFATIINAGSTTATGCRIAAPAGNFNFAYQTTDPSTNQVTGSPNTPVNIGAGVAQSFVIAFETTGPIAPTDVQLDFRCDNAGPAQSIVGLNTLLLSASASAVADIVALGATLSNNGIANVLNTSSVFAVATVNVGSADTITATADTGTGAPPVAIALCQTNPSTGQCLGPMGP